MSSGAGLHVSTRITSLRQTRAQVRGSNTLLQPSPGIPHYSGFTKGFAVMDNAALPIVGRDGKEPNDNFIPQLYLDAHAAIQVVAKMGIATPIE